MTTTKRAIAESARLRLADRLARPLRRFLAIEAASLGGSGGAIRAG
jgi:hypothetical protein